MSVPVGLAQAAQLETCNINHNQSSKIESPDDAAPGKTPCLLPRFDHDMTVASVIRRYEKLITLLYVQKFSVSVPGQVLFSLDGSTPNPSSTNIASDLMLSSAFGGSDGCSA